MEEEIMNGSVDYKVVLSDLESRKASLEKRLDDLKSAIDGIRNLLRTEKSNLLDIGQESSETHKDQTGESLTKRVYLVFQQHPERTFRIRDVIKAIWYRGDPKAIRSIIWRLEKGGMVEKISRGIYRFRTTMTLLGSTAKLNSE